MESHITTNTSCVVGASRNLKILEIRIRAGARLKQRASQVQSDIQSGGSLPIAIPIGQEGHINTIATMILHRPLEKPKTKKQGGNTQLSVGNKIVTQEAQVDRGSPRILNIDRGQRRAPQRDSQHNLNRGHKPLFSHELSIGSRCHFINGILGQPNWAKGRVVQILDNLTTAIAVQVTKNR